MKKRISLLLLFFAGIVLSLNAQDATIVEGLSNGDIERILGAWCNYADTLDSPTKIRTYSWGDGINIINSTQVIDWEIGNTKVLNILIPGLYKFPIARIEKLDENTFRFLLKLPQSFLNISRGFPSEAIFQFKFIDAATVYFQEDDQVLFGYQKKEVTWYKIAGPSVGIPEKYKGAKNGEVFNEGPTSP